MKQYIRHIALVIAAFLVAEFAWGENWSGEMSGTKTISETINVTGTVLIKNGKTLTIQPSGANRTIRPSTKLDSNPMFKIENGGKLMVGLLLVVLQEVQVFILLPSMVQLLLWRIEVMII